jgi:hypothetical protein
VIAIAPREGEPVALMQTTMMAVVGQEGIRD